MHAEYTISGRRTRVCLRAAASRCACSCLASFSFTIAAPGCPLRLNLDVERARRKVRQRVLALGSAGQKRHTGPRPPQALMATMAPPSRTLTMLPQPHRLLPQRHDHVRRRLRLLRRRPIPIPVTAAASAAIAAAAAIALAHQADALGKAVVRVQLPGRELPGLPLHWNSAPASSTASPTAASTPWLCRGARRLHRDHGDELLPLGLVEASHPRLVGLGARVGLGAGVGLRIRLRLRRWLRRGLRLAAAARLLLRREHARTAAAAGRSREESTASNSASNRASASAASASAASAPAAAAADSPPPPPPPTAAPWSSWAGASRSTPSLALRCHTHGPSPEP